jgi:lipopolysaccharide export system protein LptA
VRADGADGLVRGQQATVYLKEPAPKEPAPPDGSAGPSQPAPDSPILAGNVDRIVATGNIQIDQPGLHGTGSRLVYTSSDGWFVLTGDSAALPKVVDATHGTITGALLRFHSGDKSIFAGPDPGGGPGQRIHSETHSKQ